MMIASFIFLFAPAMLLFGYQSILEAKGINDPTLAISLYKTSIILDIAIKLLLYYIVDDLDTFVIISIFATLVFFFWFYVRLSLNIPKKSLRKFRKFPQDTNYTLCAFQVIGWCALSTLFNLFLLLFGWIFEEPAIIYTLCFLIVIMMIFYMSFAAKSLIRLDRLKYPSTRSLNALSHNNSPIVLLRSFKIDSYPATNGKVFDETICENLDLDSNPIISLANPDEILPSGGSLKIQAKDAEWKEVVRDKQLFVLIPSNTYRELAWCYNDEAGTGLYSIMRNAHKFMARITLSGKKYRKQILNSIWIDFSSKLQQFEIHLPKVFPGDDCLLSFDQQWNSIKQANLHKTNEKLKFIVSQTSTFNNPNFDYPKLGEKIASFEVNGFLNKEEIAPFKQLVDKCNRLGRIVALSCMILFITVLIFS